MYIREELTKPYDDQKAGTSGLRKKVKVFQQKNYLENFVQSVFNVVKPDKESKGLLVIGGDGRYFNNEAIDKILAIGAANGVVKFIVGHNGIMSTPAASHIIRTLNREIEEKHEDYDLLGGLILTASHNPGGPECDFGIKYNTKNGAPASEVLTDKIYQETRRISKYSIAYANAISKDTFGSLIDTSSYGIHEIPGRAVVQIIDSVDLYARYMSEIFDFEQIKIFKEKFPVFKFAFDGLNGVTGPYATKIFGEILQFPVGNLINCKPLQDFGGFHPDPNLVYAKSLVEYVEGNDIHLGAASDGDGDRNMIYGKNCFVSPGDSLALIAHHAKECIPYFSKGLKGLARSMPTSKAVDLVAKKLNVSCYCVPTGWKFFCNLFDNEMLSICGEESFGTGSDHVREKDGLWAIISWLSICSKRSLELGKLVTPKDLLEELWSIYGRVYFSRYDFENLSIETGSAIMTNAKSVIDDRDEINKKFKTCQIVDAGDFEYLDSITKEESKHQGIYFNCSDNSRIVVRLSGTGSSGATLRLYLEKPSNSSEEQVSEILANVKDMAYRILDLEKFNVDQPDVIT